MLGEMIGEAKGKRTARRVISTDGGLRIEVSFEDKGKLLGHDIMDIGTYWSAPRPDGSLYGEGQGGIMTADGQFATWKGQGVGKLLPGGAVSYRGAIYLSTPGTAFARLNSVACVFEFDVDAEGNTNSKFWEWK